MRDFSASEARLIAALDRLDAAIDRGRDRLHRQMSPPAPSAPVPDDVAAHLAVARADNRRLSDEVAALHDRQGATLAALQQRLTEAHERLEGVGQQSARLAAANDGLAAANRALIEAADDWPAHGAAATLGALEAEIESLRAARAAEIAQMGEILDALDRLLGTPSPAAPRQPRRTHARRSNDDMPPLPGLSDDSAAQTGPEPDDAAAGELGEHPLPEEIWNGEDEEPR